MVIPFTNQKGNKVMKLLMLVFSLLLWFMAACSLHAASPNQASQPIYVLAGSNLANGFRANALTWFDLATQTVQRQVALPHSRATQVDRDPQGRLWIGFSGDNEHDDQRVQIYSAQGALLKELRPCTNPEAGITFAAHRAFVACAEHGFNGKVAVVNLETLAVETTLALQLPHAPLLLITSAASETTVVVSGLTSGDDDSSHSVLTLIDPQRLQIQAQLPLGKNTDIWQILPDRGRFYLLNVASWRQPRTQANDVLVLTPTNPPVLTTLAVAPSPLWGRIVGDSLYSYHNPTWNQINDDPNRYLTRLDLHTGQVQRWRLPEQWNAGDLAISDGQIILTYATGLSGSHDGLYRFDPMHLSLSLIGTIPDAANLLGAN